MNDKELEAARKRVEEARKKLGLDGEPAAAPEEVKPTEVPVKPTPAEEPVETPAAEGEPTPSEEPEGEQTSAIEPAPETETKPEPDARDAEIARQKAIIDEQRKKINDEDGQRGAALQSLRHENALLFEQLRQLRAELEEKRGADESSIVDPGDREDEIQAAIARIPKAEREKYDPQYLHDVIANQLLVKLALPDAGDTELRKQIDTIGKTQQEIAAEKWLSDADRTAAAAGAEGFITANQSDQGWGQYLEQPVFPGSAMTRKQFLEQPGTQPRAAAEMYVQYKGATAPSASPAATPQPGPQRPSLREMVTTRPSATPGRKETPQTMTRAEYERRRQDAAYANGDPAKQKAWSEAKRFLAEGRVSG